MIQLIPFTKEQFPILKKWLNQTSPVFLMKWGGVTFEYPLTDKQLEKYILGANRKDSESYIFTVIESNSKRPIGHVALRKVDYNHRSARLGKLLIGEERDRGKRLTPLIINQVLQYAFETLHLHRVTLGVFDNNTHAKQIYETYGFKEEGYFRDFRRVDAHYWGMYEMSILEHEWRNIQNTTDEPNHERISNKLQKDFR
ncbi:GNAT family N-acetyltransferase [Salipaludibacillus keqinensis]|uniref:GNAT family N-acetyltransferase n=1 Tax=Salipaludibacillus keqinensis TaxID=2045207 RepID=A0A323TFV0_9BACI|nr:GNAT family protein [Salipaludibacillus keqinensis]PYZ94052.1 GNAT family N-acetyltransferase [Salipaludibacillus keqinensis]